MLSRAMQNSELVTFQFKS